VVAHLSAQQRTQVRLAQARALALRGPQDAAKAKEGADQGAGGNDGEVACVLVDLGDSAALVEE
jgi:hypothetical protein